MSSASPSTLQTHVPVTCLTASSTASVIPHSTPQGAFSPTAKVPATLLGAMQARNPRIIPTTFLFLAACVSPTPRQAAFTPISPDDFCSPPFRSPLPCGGPPPLDTAVTSALSHYILHSEEGDPFRTQIPLCHSLRGTSQWLSALRTRPKSSAAARPAWPGLHLQLSPRAVGAWPPSDPLAQGLPPPRALGRQLSACLSSPSPRELPGLHTNSWYSP